MSKQAGSCARWTDPKEASQKSSLLDYLENIQYYIPGTSTLATVLSPATQPPSGLIPGYIALILLSAAASALGCFQLARRYAFSRARRIGWALVGFFFGWVGLVLMLVLQEWPARIACPKCRKLRVVTRDTCEHCGAPHAAPALDGTEIFESAATLTTGRLDGADLIGRLTMKSLIWKEWRENLRWIPLPSLVILLVTLISRPLTPMPDVTGAYFFCVIAVVFGAALGFLQIFFEAYGDQRSLLLHRPISRSRIFLAKVIAGVGLYVLALGVPFACLEIWFATPGKLPAPYHWRTSLPWLADILSGLVYYFAGMLVAQREVRWYGSRGLALTAAFFCSYLVWNVPEFWQALVAIGIIGLFVGVAAWGSFCAGGAYTPQPPLARAALAMTLLTGLLILSMLGKQIIGEGFDSGIEYHYDLD